jgi:MYXO-CTERM domain-containing protein
MRRGKAPGCTGGSCDDIGTVRITVAPTDDRTPPLGMGYRMRVISGPPPAGLNVPTDDVRASEGTWLFLSWGDGAEDDQEPFSFTLSIEPVDLAGHVGEARLVMVSDPGSGGCAVAGGPGEALWPAVVLAWLVGTRRRRRRRGLAP